jgi:hypothetical protein
MTGPSILWYRSTALPRLALGLILAFGAACTEDGVAPSETAALPLDSTTTAEPGDTVAPTPLDDGAAPSPGDSAPSSPDSAPPPPSDSGEYGGVGASGLDTRSGAPGIVFGTFSMDSRYLDNVHNGSLLGGPIEPSTVISKLTAFRAKGARMVVKLSKGKDSYVQNGDGTFSLTKWKALVDRYRSVNLAPFIADGTIVGHYLIDEPHNTARWGGKVISQATLEEMARHSKRIWPDMTTFVRVVPSWLASAPITYVHLDAGWTQYVAGKGDPAKWVAAEAAAARRKGLGLAVGLNVLKGGKGAGRPPMTASEIRSYGTAMLNESLACAFYMWTHDTDYYGRSDIRSAMADLSVKARAHVKTSCRQ